MRLEPVHVLQCHSKMDSREDFSTQLWSCSFQPQHSFGTDPFSAPRPGPVSEEVNPFVSAGALVATCGGDTLCLVDCETGTVMKKYKVAGEVCSCLLLRPRSVSGWDVGGGARVGRGGRSQGGT